MRMLLLVSKKWNKCMKEMQHLEAINFKQNHMHYQMGAADQRTWHNPYFRARGFNYAVCQRVTIPLTGHGLLHHNNTSLRRWVANLNSRWHLLYVLLPNIYSTTYYISAYSTTTIYEGDTTIDYICSFSFRVFALADKSTCRPPIMSHTT